MDPTLTMIAAGGLVLLLVILLVLRRRRLVDRFDDLDNPRTSDTPDGGEGDISIEATTRRKSKPSRKSASGCDHHYEMRGFPADKLGTHVIVVCTKCQERQTVTLAEAEQMLRQRDDVRQAIQRARGEDAKS